MKILVVDDESLIRKSLSRAARSRGHDVLEANGGAEGIKIWKKHQPDLVFLDVLMPKISGPQVLKEIAEDDAAKVILISAYTGEYDLEKAKHLGADLFLPKPFEDIFEVVSKGEELVSE